jgi:protein O-GlcNAc transferase
MADGKNQQPIPGLGQSRSDTFAQAFNEGRRLHAQGRLVDAISAYARAIKLEPENADLLNDMGAAYLDLGRLPPSQEALEKALVLRPDFPLALNNMGNLQKIQGRAEASEASYRRALEIDPDFCDAAANLGLVLVANGSYAEARKWLQHSLKLETNHIALNGMGLLSRALNEHANAVEWYDKALNLVPDSYEILNNQAGSYQELGRFKDASEAYNRALDVDPGRYEAYQNLAVMLLTIDKYDEAVTAYRMALQINPDNRAIYPHLAVALTYQCAWENLKGIIDQVIANTEKELDENLPLSATPFGLISLPITDEMRARVTHRTAHDIEDRVRQTREANPFAYAPRGDKIKVGLVGPDFRRHSAAFLFNGICEHFDRQRFEFHGYMLSAKHDDMTEFFKEQLDGFHDLSTTPLVDAARQINDAGVNILVDLAGHTRGSWLELFAMHPAPLQASAIGFGSAIGGDILDYLISDDTMFSPDERAFCSEHLVYLPQGSLPGSPRERSNREYVRSDVGLPETGVVFANFNGHYKIDPETFGLWMHILARVPDSVLWIMKGSETSRANLRKEAEVRGVSADRLVFAEPIDPLHHLSRLPLADIALDGYNLEGGATTLDALWSGVPVVVTSGSPYGHRGRYKMLEVGGLPEMIGADLREYERIAVELALNPKKLAAVRAKLATNNAISPLFNVALFTRHFERGLEMMWDNFEAGQPPKDLTVPILD